MATKKTYQTHFRRRREGKTDYVKRLALVKSGQLRLVIRKTNQRVIAELVLFETTGDKTIVFASSSELKKFGWNASTHNLPAAYLTGLLLAKKALAKQQKKAILDIGLQTAHPKGVVFATAKGVIDGGLSVAVGADALPSMARIRGEHIETFAKQLPAAELARTFSGYLKNGFDPKQFQDAFEKTKTQLSESTPTTQKR